MDENCIFSQNPFGMRTKTTNFQFGSFRSPEKHDSGLMDGRSYSSERYRFGFNTQEKDNEIYGIGNSTSAEFWQYDCRLGRRFNIDPKPNSGISVYACFGNNPIWNTDHKGDTIVINLGTNDAKFKAISEKMVFEQVNDGMFIVIAHGWPGGIRNDNDMGKLLTTPQDIYKVLSLQKDFKKSLDNKTPIELIFASCNTATDFYEYYCDDEEFKNTKHIVQLISEDKINWKVSGPNGYATLDFSGKMVIGRDDIAGVTFVSSIIAGHRTVSNGVVQGKGDKGFRTYMGGIEITNVGYLTKTRNPDGCLNDKLKKVYTNGLNPKGGAMPLKKDEGVFVPPQRN